MTEQLQKQLGRIAWDPTLHMVMPWLRERLADAQERLVVHDLDPVEQGRARELRELLLLIAEAGEATRPGANR